MLPNFIIAGVQKSGTTSLYEYLKMHPDVFMCPYKEPHYFIPGHGITDISEYESLFEGVESESAIGEASVGYFHCEDSPSLIDEQVPEATIILLLRDPASRAFSHYNMLREKGEIPNRPFIDALREAETNGAFDYTGIPTSRYSIHLRRYKDVFGKRLHVYLHRDLKKRTITRMKNVFDDIGVNSEHKIDVSTIYNKTRIPRSSVVNQLVWGTNVVKEGVKKIVPHSIVKQLRGLVTSMNRKTPPSMSPEARHFVIDKLREDIEQTEDLIGRDLSDWKE